MHAVYLELLEVQSASTVVLFRDLYKYNSIHGDLLEMIH